MSLLQNIFSVTDQKSKNNKIYTVITLLGIKFKFQNKYKTILNQLKQDIDCKFDITCKNQKLLENYLKRRTPFPYLKSFEIHFTEHCNLNCQSCSHFSPLADEEYTDMKEFESDLKRISELTNGQVDFINLMGGEPLLHPQCSEFLYISRKYFPNTCLQLVTNGILLNKMDEKFWIAMKKNNIILRPTKYPIKINWEEIEEKCEKYNVILNFYNNGQKIKTSFKFKLDIKGTLNPVEQFYYCGAANNCINLSHGKLYTCPEAPYIRHFNKFFGTNIPESEKNYIDIYKANNIEEILEFLTKPIPFCRYCNKKSMIYDLPWNTTTKNIKEWT